MSTITAHLTAEQFEEAGIRPDARPEQLAVDDWCRLAGVVSR